MIEISHLTKRYGENTAIRDLNLTLETGHVYGFLGPNGAGKSTTMNIIAGCLAATEGTVRINGHDIYEEPLAAKKCIGYLPELPPLYPDMTPEEYLSFVARAQHLARGEVFYQVQYVMDITGLMDVKDRLIENLSKGYRQRVGIAQAILGEPEIIILDEPTVGLDPKQKMDILDLIHALSAEHTVILSSHILSEISAVSDELIIISRGRIVANGTPDELRTALGTGDVIEMELAATHQQVLDYANALTMAEEITVTETDTPNVWQLRITCPPHTDLRKDAYDLLKTSPLELLSFTREEMGLEQIYLDLTGEESKTDTDIEETEEQPPQPAAEQNNRADTHTMPRTLEDLDDFDDLQGTDADTTASVQDVHNTFDTDDGKGGTQI